MKMTGKAQVCWRLPWHSPAVDRPELPAREMGSALEPVQEARAHRAPLGTFPASSPRPAPAGVALDPGLAPQKIKSQCSVTVLVGKLSRFIFIEAKMW